MKNNMVKETKSELKKVIWPSRKDVINGTVVVAVMVIVVGAIILAFDFASSALYIYKELYFTSILYLLYAIIAIFGYFKWKKMMLNER